MQLHVHQTWQPGITLFRGHAQTLLIIIHLSQSRIVRLFSWCTERNVNQCMHSLTLTLTLTVTLFKMHWLTFRSVEHEKSQTIVLWDTIHRLITFVRMTTASRDTRLDMTPQCTTAVHSIRHDVLAMHDCTQTTSYSHTIPLKLRDTGPASANSGYRFPHQHNTPWSLDNTSHKVLNIWQNNHMMNAIQCA